MPWTRRQVRYLLSKGSPLTGSEKEKMKGELHENPGMGHMAKRNPEGKKGYHKGKDVESHSYDWKRRKHA
jgi:hypothetical protein